jgi:hypothetical protein
MVLLVLWRADTKRQPFRSQKQRLDLSTPLKLKVVRGDKR